METTRCKGKDKGKVVPVLN